MNQRLIPSPDDPIEELNYQIGRTFTQLHALAASYSRAVNTTFSTDERARTFLDDLRVIEDDLSDLAMAMSVAQPYTEGAAS